MFHTLFSQRADSNSTDYSELNDDAKEFTAAFKYLWQFSDESSLTFSGGAGKLDRDRDSQILRFVYRSSGPLARDPATLILPPNQIFTPANIGPGGFTFDQTGRDTDYYTAAQTLDSYHVGVDLNWKDTWRVLLGARHEANDQNVTTGDQSNPNAELTTAAIDESDWLPAFSLTWLHSADDQFRFGYSETLSRPDFRELSLAPFTDPILDTETIGALSGVLGNWEQAKRLDARCEQLTVERDDVFAAQSRIAEQLAVLGTDGPEGELRARQVGELQRRIAQVTAIEAGIAEVRADAAAARQAATNALGALIGS